MEYEARTIKWYWVALLIMYSAGAVYLLLKSNPLLYSQGTLKSQQEVQTAESLEPWPPPEYQFTLDAKTLDPQETWPYLSEGHLNMTSPEVTRNKSYTEFKSYPLIAEYKGKPRLLTQTDSEVFLIDEDQKIFLFSDEGQLKWVYGIDQEMEFAQALIDRALLYLIHKNGSVTAIELKNGRPQWNLSADSPIMGEAWLEGENLIVPVEKRGDSNTKKGNKKATTALLKIDRRNGKFNGVTDGFEFKGPFKQLQSAHGDLRIVYSGAQVIAVPKSVDKVGAPLWSTSLPEAITGELVLTENHLFAVTEGKRLYVLNPKKKGELTFDIDLDYTPGGSLTYLPEMDRVVFMSTDSVLRVIDLKKKEMAWKFDLGVKGPMRSLWSSRLKGAYIQEFGMKWVDKGWTVWSPCRTKQFCIYNPDRGQLIQRIELSGEPVGLPMVFEKKLVAVVEQKTAEQDKAVLAVAHLLDPSELRRAEAQAGKTNPESPAPEKPAPAQ